MNTVARSKTAYFCDLPNGDYLCTRAYIGEGKLRSFVKWSKNLPESTLIEVEVRIEGLTITVETPIGGAGVYKLREKKDYVMSIKQFKEFIARFWENGPDYYHSI